MHSLTRNPSAASPTPNNSVYRGAGRLQGFSSLSQNPNSIKSRPIMTPPLRSSNDNPNHQTSNRTRRTSDRNRRRRRSEVTTRDTSTTETHYALSTPVRHVILLRGQLQEIGHHTKTIRMEVHSENKELLNQICTALKRNNQFGNSNNPTKIIVSGDTSLTGHGHLSLGHIHRFMSIIY